MEGRNEKVFEQSYSIALDYWFRLKEKRIEFYPYLSYHQANDELSISGNALVLRQFGTGLLTHFYILDLIGDCDCPTFSKQGDFFKKGFFLMAGVGTVLSHKDYNTGWTDGNFDFVASVGVGQDIGINDLFTVTPFLQYQYVSNVSWHELGTAFGQGSGNQSSNIGMIQLGLRLGIRADYK